MIERFLRDNVAPRLRRHWCIKWDFYPFGPRCLSREINCVPDIIVCEGPSLEILFLLTTQQTKRPNITRHLIPALFHRLVAFVVFLAQSVWRNMHVSLVAFKRLNLFETDTAARRLCCECVTDLFRGSQSHDSSVRQTAALEVFLTEGWSYRQWRNAFVSGTTTVVNISGGIYCPKKKIIV